MVPHLRGVPQGYSSMTCGLSGGRYHSDVLRDDSFDFESLDAPDFLASGAVRSHMNSRFSLAAHILVRPGFYS